MKSSVLIIASLLVLFWACQKEQAFVETDATALDELFISKSSTEGCGPMVYPLIAGQENEIGDVEVFSMGDKLHVIFNSSLPMNDFHLYILDKLPNKRLAPGQAPFKSGPVEPAVYSHAFEILFTDIHAKTGNGDTLYLQAHTVAEGESAYAGMITKSSKGSAWFGNFGYIIKTCEIECRNETAWAEGTKYDKGGWATFTGYAFVESTVKLIAGKHHQAGTVHFSAPDSENNVTITVDFANGWELRDVAESLKVQDYEYAPSSVGGIGNFDHKANSTTIVVPANNFYGIHLDVKKCY
jgi:hypothetical protein